MMATTPIEPVTQAAREAMASYYRHPLIANTSMAEAVLADGWEAGCSDCERAMLETFAALTRTTPAPSQPDYSDEISGEQMDAIRTLAGGRNAPSQHSELADPVSYIWATNSQYLVMDPEALDRWRDHAREGSGHDMASVNKNTLYRLIGTIDKLAAALRQPPSDAMRNAVIAEVREQGKKIEADRLREARSWGGPTMYKPLEFDELFDAIAAALTQGKPDANNTWQPFKHKEPT